MKLKNRKSKQEIYLAKYLKNTPTVSSTKCHCKSSGYLAKVLYVAHSFTGGFILKLLLFGILAFPYFAYSATHYEGAPVDSEVSGPRDENGNRWEFVSENGSSNTGYNSNIYMRRVILPDVARQFEVFKRKIQERIDELSALDPASRNPEDLPQLFALRTEALAASTAELKKALMFRVLTRNIVLGDSRRSTWVEHLSRLLSSSSPRDPR